MGRPYRCGSFLPVAVVVALLLAPIHQQCASSFSLLPELLSAVHPQPSQSRRQPHRRRQPFLLRANTEAASKNEVVDETEQQASEASSKSTLSLFSPCKINLFLRIIRKRPDNFHDLASLFQAIGFGDRLELTLLEEDAEKDEFTCNMAGVPVDSSNLVLRALQLMRDKTGRAQKYFRANLVKQVPAQAGLGGGSANAATAMWGANELLGRPASLEQVTSSPSNDSSGLDIERHLLIFVQRPLFSTCLADGGMVGRIRERHYVLFKSRDGVLYGSWGNYGADRSAVGTGYQAVYRKTRYRVIDAVRI